MTKELDILLAKASQAKKDKEVYESLEIEYRKQILELLQKEDIKTYKNDFATVTNVERKTIKIADRENAIQQLINKGLTNFLTLIPEQITPQHYELNKDFDDRIKTGALQLDGVEVTVSSNTMIKF